MPQNYHSGAIGGSLPPPVHGPVLGAFDGVEKEALRINAAINVLESRLCLVLSNTGCDSCEKEAQPPEPHNLAFMLNKHGNTLSAIAGRLEGIAQRLELD